MTSETFQLGQIWQRGRYHGLLLAVKTHMYTDSTDNLYTVFIFERGDIALWGELYMNNDIVHKQMRLIA